MLLLSSLLRLRRYLDVEDKPENNRLITNFLTSTTREIQQYVGRELELKSRTEYFDIEAAFQLEFWAKAQPITAITTIKHDSTGLFNGGESTLSDFYIGIDELSFVLDTPQQPGRKALELVYTGGLSAHGTQSTFVLTTPGAFVADKFVFGSDSQAWGIIKSFSTPNIVVENLYGIFEDGEVLNQAAKEGAKIGDGITGTISSITAQSLAEASPEYAQAVEMQIRYMVRRQDNFELASTQKDGQRYRENGPQFGTHEGLQPEVRSMLQHLVRVAI